MSRTEYAPHERDPRRVAIVCDALNFAQRAETAMRSANQDHLDDEASNACLASAAADLESALAALDLVCPRAVRS